MTPRTWAEIETEKLGRKYQYFSEPAITLAFLQEHRRAVRIVKRYLQQYGTEGSPCELICTDILAALERGRGKGGK